MPKHTHTNDKGDATTFYLQPEQRTKLLATVLQRMRANGFDEIPSLSNALRTLLNQLPEPPKDLMKEAKGILDEIAAARRK